MTLVITIAIALVLFGLAFVTKRRFGVLGLGLAAGAVLAQSWSSDLARVLTAQHVPVDPLSAPAAATIVLTMVPALLLLIAGPKYTVRRYAFMGALLFAILGTSLLLGPLTTALPIMDGGVKPAFDLMAEWQNLLIASGIALAIVDMLHANSSKPHGKKH